MTWNCKCEGQQGENLSWWDRCEYCGMARPTPQQSALGQQRPRAADDYLRAGFVNEKDLANIQAELGQQQAGRRLASARAITVHDEQAMAALPLSARYDVVERECERLRARVAELETDRREMEAAKHTEYEQRDALRRRVAELEQAELEQAAINDIKGNAIDESLTITCLKARVAELEAMPTWGEQDTADRQRLEEDLRRKREECLSLETQLADYRKHNRITVEERDDARHCLGAAQAEVARLRRELGRKR